MCGFIVSPLPRNLIDAYLAHVKYRGPDDCEVVSSNGFNFGFNRLAFQGGSQLGAQPMNYLDRWLIVFNGEIYNSQQLIEFIEKGNQKYLGTQNSDTEVLAAFLAVVIEDQCWEAISIIDGIFSFVILDKVSNTLFYGNDRFGVKPLFVVNSEETVSFVSDISYFNSLELRSEKIFTQYIHHPMSLGPSDLYQGIEAVVPGVIYAYSINERATKEIYCCRKTLQGGELRSQLSLITLSKNLEGAIRRNLVGDYPGCLLLSGGVDSSLLSLLAARSVLKESIVGTYSVSFTNDKNSETKYRDEILIKQKNIKNTELVIDPELFFINLIEYVKKSRRLPVIPNEIALFALFRRISKDGYRMALSGEGADEIFDGYHYIRDAAITNLLRSFLALPLIKKIAIKVISKFGHRFLRYLEDPDSLLRIISAGNHIYYDLRGYYDLKRIKELLIDYYLTGLLYRADNASMMNSVELRVPFLSNLITDRYLCLPNEFLSIIFPPKFLPKLLLASLVNFKFAFSKKRGFAIPWGSWYLESKEFKSLWEETKSFVEKTNLFNIPDGIEVDAHFGDFFERIGFRLMSVYLYSKGYNKT